MLPATALTNTSLFDIDALIDGIRKRDELSFLKLYDHYACSLLTFIIKILPEKQLAEEALQCVFTKAFVEIEDFNEHKSSLFMWLINLSRKEAIEILIKKNEEKVFLNMAVNQVVPSKYFAGHELISTLNPIEKTITALMFYRCLNAVEIADILKMPVQFILPKVKSAQEKFYSFYPDNCYSN